jgi:capsular exopolysaccharide synthesis family protein
MARKGFGVNLRDFTKLIRNRWVTVVVTALITILGTVAYTLLQTPQYQASTRLFVSTTSGSSVSDLYSGNRLSQERVLSYTQLIMGETLAQRTIDLLQLNMSAAGLKARVTAKSKPDTVLIDVSVIDESPVQARDIANALSDEFVVMARELETPTRGARPEARVVVEQRATVPTSPVVPQKKRNLALGILLGGVLGLGLALLRDLLDNTVKSQETLEEITGTGVVGYIPFEKRLGAEPAISFDTDNSSAAEAFRKLRTNLQFLSVDNPPRVIVITSASPSEGKSTAAINIALALAEAEQNVVLVDGDLRRPRIAKYLNVVGSVGLSNALSGAAPLAEVLQTTKYPQLSVLAAGPTPPNPSELLGSRTAEKLFGELRTQFDYVIIDSAPLLAVTDGAVLAAHADGALVVVRASKTKRDQLRHAMGMLNDVGATVLGGVLTMMPTRGSGVYSYNYYYYGGSYGDDKRDSKRDQISEAS